MLMVVSVSLISKIVTPNSKTRIQETPCHWLHHASNPWHWHESRDEEPEVDTSCTSSATGLFLTLISHCSNMFMGCSDAVPTLCPPLLARVAPSPLPYCQHSRKRALENCCKTAMFAVLTPSRKTHATHVQIQIPVLFQPCSWSLCCLYPVRGGASTAVGTTAGMYGSYLCIAFCH
jgi:hypothetical protein